MKQKSHKITYVMKQKHRISYLHSELYKLTFNSSRKTKKIEAQTDSDFYKNAKNF